MKQYLSDDLWDDVNIYDAGHHVMVPMHAAFKLKDDEWMNDIRDFMKRVVLNLDKIEGAPADQTLNFVQFAYLMSRYIVLESSPHQNELTQIIGTYLDEEICKIWTEYPAWLWGREPFDNMRERVDYKLTVQNPEFSYYRAIFDVEIFTMAIAADLIQWNQMHGGVLKNIETHNEIVKYAKAVFDDRVNYTNENAWVFQPGVWTDHPDYQYAGHKEKGANLEKMPVPGIAEDSSHSHRMPLWLVSLRDSYSEEDIEHTCYDELLEGFAKQLLENVLFPISEEFNGIRMTNYMDGQNGLYRWNYATTSQSDDGYGPYELSLTFLIGWWSFTGNQEVKNIYGEMAACFPLAQEVIEVYVGPNTTRERNEFIELPESLNKGLYELICILASKL